MSLIGSKEEFLKNFFAGNELQLPIKGTHIIKTDHPIILSSSNHSLRELFINRFQTTCQCPITNDTSFCSNKQNCYTPQPVKNLYKALRARIVPIEIKEPLFPDGDQNPSLFYE